jgi:hypothetical protein
LDKHNGHFTCGTIYNINHIPLTFSQDAELFKQNRRENQNVRFVLNNFFQNSYRFLDNVEKYGRTGEATGDNMAHVHFTLST